MSEGSPAELLLLFAKWRDESSSLRLLLGQPGSLCMSAENLKVTKAEPGMVELSGDGITVLLPLRRVTWGYVEPKDLPDHALGDDGVTACVGATLAAGERVWIYVNEAGR